MKKSFSTFYYAYGILGAILYSLPVVLFIATVRFADQWMLYIGNFLLLMMVFFSVIQYNRIFGGNASLSAMIMAGLKTALISIIISCLILVILYFANKDKSLLQAPGEMINGKKNGLWSVLFLDATIVNVFATAFASLMAAISSKRNQKPVQDNIHHA